MFRLSFKTYTTALPQSLTRDNGDHALNELARLHDADRSMSRSAANVLYRTYAGTLTERRATRQDRIDMAALTNRGALAAGAGLALSADTTCSLMLDEDGTTTT